MCRSAGKQSGKLPRMDLSLCRFASFLIALRVKTKELPMNCFYYLAFFCFFSAAHSPTVYVCKRVPKCDRLLSLSLVLYVLPTRPSFLLFSFLGILYTRGGGANEGSLCNTSAISA